MARGKDMDNDCGEAQGEGECKAAGPQPDFRAKLAADNESMPLFSFLFFLRFFKRMCLHKDDCSIYRINSHSELIPLN
jgi:hypothetical protein